LPRPLGPLGEPQLRLANLMGFSGGGGRGTTPRVVLSPRDGSDWAPKSYWRHETDLIGPWVPGPRPQPAPPPYKKIMFVSLSKAEDHQALLPRATQLMTRLLLPSEPQLRRPPCPRRSCWPHSIAAQLRSPILFVAGGVGQMRGEGYAPVVL